MTTDNLTPQMPHIDEDDLVLFALQLLPEDRMREAKQHMAACELCRTEVARLQGDLVAYSMTAEMAPPPPAARERLMRQVAKEPRAPEPEEAPVPVAVETRPPSEPVFSARHSRRLEREEPVEENPERSRPRRAPWVLAAAGWAVAAGCAFFAGLQLHQRQQLQSSMADQQARLDDTTKQATHARDALSTLTAANAVQIALRTPPPAKPAPGSKTIVPTGPSPEALAAYLADKGALVFVATNLQPAPPGKTYELWLLPADGRNPMPAGTFHPDAQGSASIVMPQLPKGVPAKTFAVTLENDGGSDTPTMPLVMSGT
jgi:anti-sigma-K factor RskA